MVKQSVMSIQEIMLRLKEEYEKTEFSRDWGAEEPIIREMLETITKRSNFNYELAEPIGPGSSGIVLKVIDRNLRVNRALKIPRPIDGKITFSSKIVRQEMKKLTRLNHQNIVKVYHIDNAEVRKSERFPFFVMEYIDGAEDLKKYISTKKVTLDKFARLLKQILEGLYYLHSNGIVHCDIKPSNILIQRLNEKSIPLITDLGYAKYTRKKHDRKVSVRCSYKYAAPVLRGSAFRGAEGRYSVISELRSKDVDFKLDLFSLGITVLWMLDIILNNDEEIDEYKRKYLTLIGARLLVGWTPEEDQLPLSIRRAKWFKDRRQIIRGILPTELSVFSYSHTAEASMDIGKLLDEYNLSESIPELNPLYPNLIQLPGRTKVPFTDRVKDIIEHPKFNRLSNISQLGLVKLVYPGATHTRAEHCLGTFANACQYVAALYYSQTNPLFKSIMREKDLEAVLLAALLHDIGQYPLAHDLEEADSFIFSHNRTTKQILLSEGLNSISKSLNKWRATVKDVLCIIEADPSTGTGEIRDQILHTIIDGPIDADRMDYLYRDSIRLGVPYGLGIDFDRFLKTLSVAYTETNAGSDQRMFSIAISDKGRITAESIAFARYAMYNAVYWQHTTRALKAMLCYAVRRIIDDQKAKGTLGDFQNKHETFALRTAVHKGTSGVLSKLDNNVVAEIQWFQKNGDSVSKQMLQLILERKLYRRLLVISFPRSRRLFPKLLDLQRVHAYDRVETFRKYVETYIKAVVMKKECAVESNKVPERLAKMNDPLVLVDIPYKVNDEKLPYITEGGESPDLEESIVWEQLHTNFNSAVGKIRILVHPEWHKIVSSIVKVDELEKEIRKFVNKKLR